MLTSKSHQRATLSVNNRATWQEKRRCEEDSTAILQRGQMIEVMSIPRKESSNLVGNLSKKALTFASFLGERGGHTYINCSFIIIETIARNTN